MGLLAVDVTIHGVVMSADSQRVNIFGGRNEVEIREGERSRLPIIMRTGGGFVGLVGFAGTETIEGKETTDWLRGFSDAHPDEDVDAFCLGLADSLTESWSNEGLISILEILVAGEVSGVCSSGT